MALSPTLRALDRELRERNDDERRRIFGPHPCETCGTTTRTLTVQDETEHWHTFCAPCLVRHHERKAQKEESA